MNMKRLILCSLFMLSAIVSFAQQLFTWLSRKEVGKFS